MAKLRMTMMFDSEDNENVSPSSDMYFRDLDLTIEMGTSMHINEIHKVYATFLKGLGYSTKQIDEITDE